MARLLILAAPAALPSAVLAGRLILAIATTPATLLLTLIRLPLGTWLAATTTLLCGLAARLALLILLTLLILLLTRLLCGLVLSLAVLLFLLVGDTTGEGRLTAATADGS